MGSCACLSLCVEEGYDEWGDEIRVAGTERKCVECKRQIELGEEYEYSWGCYCDEDGEVGDPEESFITCVDCASMRQAFFCDGWFIGRTWDDLGDHLVEIVRFGDGVSSDCMTSLTKSARDDVCDLIEDIWKDQEDEC